MFKSYLTYAILSNTNENNLEKFHNENHHLLDSLKFSYVSYCYYLNIILYVIVLLMCFVKIKLCVCFVVNSFVLHVTFPHPPIHFISTLIPKLWLNTLSITRIPFSTHFPITHSLSLCVIRMKTASFRVAWHYTIHIFFKYVCFCIYYYCKVVKKPTKNVN